MSEMAACHAQHLRPKRMLHFSRARTTTMFLPLSVMRFQLGAISRPGCKLLLLPPSSEGSKSESPEPFEEDASDSSAEASASVEADAALRRLDPCFFFFFRAKPSKSPIG